MISQVILQRNQRFWIAVLFNKKAGAKRNVDIRGAKQLQQLPWTLVDGHWCSGPWTALFVTRCSEAIASPALRTMTFPHRDSSVLSIPSSIFLIVPKYEVGLYRLNWKMEHTLIVLTKPTTMTVHKSHIPLFSHVQTIVRCGQKHQQVLTCCRMYCNAAFCKLDQLLTCWGRCSFLTKEPPEQSFIIPPYGPHLFR